jgi:hypothetical protein
MLILTQLEGILQMQGHFFLHHVDTPATYNAIFLKNSPTLARLFYGQAQLHQLFLNAIYPTNQFTQELAFYSGET